MAAGVVIQFVPLVKKKRASLQTRRINTRQYIPKKTSEVISKYTPPITMNDENYFE
jgi:hypothetical protein